MKVTVDRIENNLAVLLIRPEEEYDLHIPLKYLPDDMKEGDILSFDIKKDIEETKKAEKRVGDLLDKLKNK